MRRRLRSVWDTLTRSMTTRSRTHAGEEKVLQRGGAGTVSTGPAIARRGVESDSRSGAARAKLRPPRQSISMAPPHVPLGLDLTEAHEDHPARP